MRLSPSKLLRPEIMQDLERVLGPEHVSYSDSTRIAYSRDMWPKSLLRQRLGAIDKPPSVVVWPGNTQELMLVLRLAQEHQVPVIAFGAGSGVCGGTLPLDGGIVIDMKRMNRILSLVEEDRLLDVEAGMVGEVLERELNRRGWTLGHFPSSIYCSTVGGWLAGRSAGQCSSLYGKIEDMCRSITWVDSAGDSHRTRFEGSQPWSWSINPLLLGSEGTLGMITSARLVVRPLPETRLYGGYRFSSIEDGTRAMRELLRRGLRPSVLRLYDEFDTLIAKTGSTADLPEQQVKNSLMSELLGTLNKPLRMALRGSIKRVLQAPALLNAITGLLPKACLMVVVYEGQKRDMGLLKAQTDEICRKNGANLLGESPAKYWWEHRYGISYKQSTIFSAGGFVDTMEVSCTWDRLAGLYHSVKASLKELVFIMAHFSHAYRDGCSIYFTFAGAARDDVQALELYDRIWDAAQRAVFEAGGTVSHHHGVGIAKARFLVRQLGPAMSMMNAAKQAFDPSGLLNPGKLGQAVGPQDKPTAPPSMGLDKLLAELKADLGSHEVLPPEKATVPVSPSPRALIRPSSAREVSRCLVLAGKCRAKVVVRGHGTRLGEDLGEKIRGDYFILDTSSLTGVLELNPESLWVKVSAGTALSVLFAHAKKAGYRPLGISEKSSGTVGGWLSENSKVPDAILGIAQPATNSIEAVLASGKIVKSARTPRSAVGPDLFSILTGTGGGFGVITSACLKLEPLPSYSMTMASSFSSVGKALALARSCLLGLVPPSGIMLTIKGKPGRRRAVVSVELEGDEKLVRAASKSISSKVAAMGGKSMDISVAESSHDFSAQEGVRILEGNLTWSRVQRVLRGADGAFGKYLEAFIDRAELACCRLKILVPSTGDKLEQQKVWMDLLDQNGKQRIASENDAGWMQSLREQMDPDGLLNPQAWPLVRQEWRT